MFTYKLYTHDTDFYLFYDSYDIHPDICILGNSTRKRLKGDQYLPYNYLLYYSQEELGLYPNVSHSGHRTLDARMVHSYFSFLSKVIFTIYTDTSFKFFIRKECLAILTHLFFTNGTFITRKFTGSHSPTY